MANYQNLKSAIASVIKANGNNEITGNLLQSELLSMVTVLGAGYQFMDVATPLTNPGTPDARVFYLAFEPGTYTNFNGIAVTGFCVLRYDSTWRKTDIPISGGGGGVSFETQPDDLKLQTVGSQSVLKFADRIVGNNTQSGKNYTILREDATFAQQVINANTIYEIRYNFALSANFTVPSGCELRFNGGSILGGGYTITMSKTLISGNGKFVNCQFSGTIINGRVKLSWFTDGMGNENDYSVDHTNELISAMRLTALKPFGWLDLERIPICIKQTIVITEAFGNIGIRNGDIYFVSSADYQPLFDYRQTASYKGFYSPIVDCRITDVGDNYNTCTIKKTAWSDTVFTYWRDLQIYGFTGYFFVNNQYLQECTFENISVYGCGFFTNNSDALYSGGVGSGNILNFLNCNTNGGENNSKTTIKAILDLSCCIEATLHNTVFQGRIGGTNILPLYISQTASAATHRGTFVLDGMWVEYPAGNVLNKIKVENASVRVSIMRNSPIGLEVVNSNASFEFKQAGAIQGNIFWPGISIDSVSNVTLDIDFTAYGADFITKDNYNIFIDLVKRGIIRNVNSSVPPYGANTTQAGLSINLRAKNGFDAKREYINKITNRQITGRPLFHFLSNVNGVPVLNIENNGQTGTYYENAFLSNWDTLLGGNIDTNVARTIYVEIIYRATILVDVTSENLSNVYCEGRGFLNFGGGSTIPFITPVAGMSAGETTGWIRSGFCSYGAQYGFTSGSYMKIRNCRLEIAKFVVRRRNVEISDDIYVDGDGALQRMDKRPDSFYIPISAANDNVSDMSTIINDCLATIETPKNVYKNLNGNLYAMIDERAKSGTTAQRPTLSASDGGFVYYDTTLGKAIIWSGTAWVNMDGTALVQQTS